MAARRCGSGFKYFWWVCGAFVLCLLVLALGLRAGADTALAAGRASDGPMTTPTPTPTCGAGWGIVASPSVGSLDNFLNGVAVVSASDIWAVGTYYDDNFLSHTLTEHWDGTAWTVKDSPSPSSLSNVLQGVAAISSNDVWAVGSTEFGSLTLAEHWDGTSWSVVASPNAPGNGSLFNAVSAVSASDVWAVGYYFTPDVVQQTLIEHWDGTAWTVVSSPNVGAGNNVLYWVAASAANDVWAVGSAQDEFGVQATLTEHWDGSSWSVVASPNTPTETDNVLYSVSAKSASDVWAVGYYFSTAGPTQTLIEHWDGASWSIVASPNFGSFGNELHGVTAISTSDAWAVGYYYNSTGSTFTLSEHWNGSAWSVVAMPDAGPNSALYAVAPVSASDIWTVGQSNDGTANRTLTERYHDPCGPIIVGHVTWQGRPAQPSVLQQLPITLTVKLGTTEADYPLQSTDASGNFTVPVGTLANGTYNWRAKDPKYLANAGTLILSGAPVTHLEVGLMRTGDANDDNVDNSTDFTILRATFGRASGQPGYDDRADFTGDLAVNVGDFALLKLNFGQGGAPPIRP